VDPQNPAYSSIEGVLFNKNRTTLIQAPGAKIGSYAIPEGVTTIATNAFAECFQLTGVRMPNSVTVIEDWAFFGCLKLASAEISHSVSSIPHRAFAACWALTSVVIPNSVTRIGRQAFLGCTSLTNVTIGSRVTTIDNEAFSGCRILVRAEIPASVTYVGAAVFMGCTELAAVHFEGNAPVVYNDFFAESYNVVVYYLPGTTGWEQTFGDRPTSIWARPQPTILSHDSRFGVQTNGFGFVVSWATNATVVVDASSFLAPATWSPVSTNTLTNGVADFLDPDWAGQPARFYRVRQQ
jgi:hypothetical protein